MGNGRSVQAVRPKTLKAPRAPKSPRANAVDPDPLLREVFAPRSDVVRQVWRRRLQPSVATVPSAAEPLSQRTLRPGGAALGRTAWTVVPCAGARAASNPSHPLARLTQFLIGHLLLRPLTRLVWNARVFQAAPLPTPCVFASNHRSFFDPVLVGMCSRDPIAYFARANLWRLPVVGMLLRIMRSIPVERENPGLSSMRGAVERLRAGISVLVFPEGTRTRNGRLGRLREGPALFARRAGVPLVPVYLYRTEAAWPLGWPLPLACRGRIEVRIGSPLSPPADLPVREQDAWMLRQLEEWMRWQEGTAGGQGAKGAEGQGAKGAKGSKGAKGTAR